jgi:hypothetical protein
MTIGAAIDAARAEVCLSRQHDGYAVRRYDHGYRAWVLSPGKHYAVARAQCGDVVAERALLALLDSRGIAAFDVARDVERRAAQTCTGYETITIRARVVRALAQWTSTADGEGR